MKTIFVVLLIAMVMEPITAYTHRFIMHSSLWIWHKSHHKPNGTRLELNDLFPIVFSIISIGLFVAGIYRPIFTAIAIGITLYGALYFLVHEVIIHSRLGQISSKNRLFSYWRFGHNVHHQFNKGPYGFIVPITPTELATKARNNPRDLLDRF